VFPRAGCIFKPPLCAIGLNRLLSGHIFCPKQSTSYIRYLSKHLPPSETNRTTSRKKQTPWKKPTHIKNQQTCDLYRFLYIFLEKHGFLVVNVVLLKKWALALGQQTGDVLGHCDLSQLHKAGVGLSNGRVDDKNADDVFTMCKFNIIILYVDGLFLGE
jgi:hypothetical protein